MCSNKDIMIINDESLMKEFYQLKQSYPKLRNLNNKEALKEIFNQAELSLMG